MNRATFIVEDNVEARRGLGLALEELAGVQVIGMADSESEAVAWLTQAGNPWDLAVIDVDLREGSGFGVLQSIHARSSAQRVVVLSNHAEPDIRRACLALGAEQVFHKTLELERFFEYCRSDVAEYRIS